MENLGKNWGCGLLYPLDPLSISKIRSTWTLPIHEFTTKYDSEIGHRGSSTPPTKSMQTPPLVGCQ